MKNGAERLADIVGGSGPVHHLALLLTGSSLRILAYHGIEDSVRFAQHMSILRNEFNPVGGGDVIGAINGTSPLPPRAVWITFDDAHPTVIDDAMPILGHLELPSTMFVCPGVVDTRDPYWWQVTETFYASGLPALPSWPIPDASAATQRLKAAPDNPRRAVIADMRKALREADVDIDRRQVTTAELKRYVETGGSLGNHSWDHPCLDTCAPEEQRRQVAEAHEWLQDRFAPAHLVFAYPNGNWSQGAEEELSRLDYAVAVLFDHRLADPRRQPPLGLSRLRVSSLASVERFRAILNGSHPLLHRLRMSLT